MLYLDLQVGYKAHYQRYSSPLCDRSVRMLDKLNEMNKQLLYGSGKDTNIKFVHCQRDACVIGKK